MKIDTIVFLLLIGAISLWTTSCKHDSFIVVDDDMVPIDSMPVDTADMGIPCDPDLTYFNLEILPILNSNCAFSGCHNASSAQDGVILDNYANVVATGDVEAFDLDGSELYEVLVETDLDKRMPPPPLAALNQDQIQLVAQWILQGAKNLECDPNAGGCNTTDVSYAATVVPVLNVSYVGCHSGGSPQGGIDLSTYTGVKAVANNGKLVGSISWDANFSNMPQGGAKLSTCVIDQIKSWVDAGALNN